ncbi:FAD/NAD(P)-binding oxidoreductase [Exiguobacterium sp. SRB7LM]|uniref:NAD(P)/FAD-dependent oxidoreductase n=1 Tax=Exiguobacterium sp. SRB7LM TaxID=2608401 RepID=UPI0018C41D9F|nr:FAD/NAD(P)-binding oxidoreductase [Exiguobacterium sp. SRB7LM]MBG0918149.1 NAD(P)/FAD-dependent oxidoreductase [Exiguobacterium sp. SRB7LM]
MRTHYRIIIIGAGTGGISVAVRLLREKHHLKDEILLIDPATTHYYQPLWTLVGAGIVKKEESARTMDSLIPDGAEWLQDHVTTFDPGNNQVETSSHGKIRYDFLIVSPGIEIDWGRITGLKAALGTKGVCSNYSYEHVDYTWNTLEKFTGGTALFTHPASPVKCGGAPQKIMYLAEEYLMKTGVRDSSRVVFGSANPAIFDVAKYRDALEKVLERKQIETHFRVNLTEIKADEKIAIFENLDSGESFEMSYDLIHVTPPMQAPAVVRNSSLADSGGWVDVDKHTLQHKQFKNVFGLGDCTNLPTSKTGAAIRKQAPVVVQNVLDAMYGHLPTASYDGYSSCPIVTGYGSLILAEFDYDKIPQESMPFNQAKERRSMYILKKDFLPIMYWNGMLKGTM